MIAGLDIDEARDIARAYGSGPGWLVQAQRLADLYRARSPSLTALAPMIIAMQDLNESNRAGSPPTPWARLARTAGNVPNG